MTDDFGTMDVVVRKLERLLVPATKQSGQAPPAPTISDINTLDLDHYTCYNIKPLDKFDHILGVFVRDQCTDSKAIMIQKPSRLCTAVDKGGDGVGLQNPDALLMCYQVKMAPGVKKNPRVTDIWVADQFFDEGTELGKKLRTTLPKEACIPATAQIL